MYSRILVPLDGSDLAEQVLPYVRALGRSLKSPIELISTFEAAPEEVADPRHGHYAHQIDASTQADSLDYLNGIKSGSLDDLGVEVSCTINEGHPAEWIVAEAEKQADTLIAMSTHGRSGMARFVMGSTTDKVLRAASSPMLIVRCEEGAARPREVQLQTAIVPLDGSPLAERILAHVTTIAKSLGISVMLVRVTPHFDEMALEYLRSIAAVMRGEGVASVEERLLHGNPAEAIVDFALETNNNLVAMTTHGRSGVGRWVLGSVTDRVVQHSGDPVLVVRSNL
ncbi:MAG: universal stress protein [Dehalococcoidia bacterium]